MYKSNWSHLITITNVFCYINSSLISFLQRSLFVLSKSNKRASHREASHQCILKSIHAVEQKWINCSWTIKEIICTIHYFFFLIPFSTNVLFSLIVSSNVLSQYQHNKWSFKCLWRVILICEGPSFRNFLLLN